MRSLPVQFSCLNSRVRADFGVLHIKLENLGFDQELKFSLIIINFGGLLPKQRDVCVKLVSNILQLCFSALMIKLFQ